MLAVRADNLVLLWSHGEAFILSVLGTLTGVSFISCSLSNWGISLLFLACWEFLSWMDGKFHQVVFMSLSVLVFWYSELNYIGCVCVYVCVCTHCTVWFVGLKFPDQGLNLGPQQWRFGVLTTGPPRNSLHFFFFFFFKYNFHFIVFSEKPIFLQSLRAWILTWALVEDVGQHPQV